VLRDLGATRSREAQIILGAAVIDDILGLVVLAVVGSAAVAAGSGGSDLSVLAVGGILLPWNERLCLAWRPHVGWVWP
jgi:Kef-type K+ transport system membrane component KefB